MRRTWANGQQPGRLVRAPDGRGIGVSGERVKGPMTAGARLGTTRWPSSGRTPVPLPEGASRRARGHQLAQRMPNSDGSAQGGHEYARRPVGGHSRISSYRRNPAGRDHVDRNRRTVPMTTANWLFLCDGVMTAPQIRSPLPRQPLRLRAPPFLHLGVIARGQDGGNFPPLPDRGPRVLRMLQKAVRMAFLLGR